MAHRHTKLQVRLTVKQHRDWGADPHVVENPHITSDSLKT